MELMIRWLRTVWFGIQVATHTAEVTFHGRCPCGCDSWVIEFRGRKIPLSEEGYDRLRFIRAVIQ